MKKTILLAKNFVDSFSRKCLRISGVPLIIVAVYVVGAWVGPKIAFSQKEAALEKLKEKAGKRGIGYQTMLKIIIAEQMDHY